jgi:hypothetical protein
MMKYKLIQLLRCLTICAVVGFSTSVSAQDIRWGGVVNPGGGSERENILHAPDHRYTAIEPPLTVSFFASASRGVLNTKAGVNPSTMHYTGLARLLGIPEALLARADVIAFEGNGGGGAGVDGGWESSDWTFTDGIHTRRVRFNEEVGASPRAGSDPSVIATGSIESSAYSAFFGMCSPDLDSPKISYILFDLHSTGPVIDTSRVEFSVTLGNGKGGEGTPDPDAIGVFVSCRTR